MSSKRVLKGRALGALLAAALVLPVAGGAGRAQTEEQGATLTEEFHQTYPLAAGGRVSLSNINGPVKIAGWDRNEVRVDAVKRARTPEALREARVKVEAGPSGVHVETEYDARNWGRDERGRRHTASVEYTLSVPRAARVGDVDVVNGALDIENLTGAVEANSVNGGVRARGLAGRVSLSVVNGRLEAALDQLGAANPVSLSAVNGQLVVTIPSDANAHLKASTVHGAISNDLGLPVREGRYVGRDLEGQLGAGGARVQLSNVNGTITIRRAADNRPQSPVRNLLSETREAEEFEDEDHADEADEQKVERKVERETRQAAREAAREARGAEREIAREAAAAAREAARVQRELHSEVQREVQREVRESLSGGGAYDDASRKIERDSAVLATKGTPRVRLTTFDGPVTVHAWDKNEVRANIVKRAFSDREMKGIKVSSNVSNDAGPNSEVTIRADFDKAAAEGAVEREGRVVSWNSGASVELDVYVPRNSTLAVTSGDGRLMVEGVRGDLELHTGDGAIDVTGAAGKLRANTGDGRILIENFDGEADARTGDGRITLDGNFRQLSARTGDGTISLALAEGQSATIETDASAVSNDGVAVAEDADEEKRIRRWRVGGGGGQPFTLRTGDGRVILQRR